MNRIAVWTFRVLVLLALLSCSSPIHATDGVIEISQAKVLAAGGHFPYVISTTGSYRLTSNLDVTNDPGNATVVQDRTAISIAAHDVTIDINGFSILGSNVCSGSPTVTSCSATGNGSGIYASNIYHGAAISNGTIKGMGSSGISIGPFGRIERVRVESNGAGGITTYPSSIVTGCLALNNATRGIFGDTSNRIIGNVVIGNSNDGIYSLAGSIVSDNTVAFNGTTGISLTGGGSVAIGNTARSNVSYGLSMMAGVQADGFGNNNLYGNNAAAMGTPQTTGGVPIGINICKGTTTCP